MSDTFHTMTTLTTLNDKDLSGVEVDDLVQAAPLLAALPAEPTDGNTYKHLKETGAPTVGFRSVNVGREYSVSTDTLVTTTLALLDASFRCDKALADQYGRGAEAYIGREAARHLKAALFALEQQIIYGTDTDADGFAGFAQCTGVDAASDTMVIDAGGTTSSTGSSVYALFASADKGVHIPVGQQGRIDIDETITQEVDDSSGKHYTAYYTPILGWMGCVTGGAYTIGRIASLTEDASCGLTDALIYQLLEQFPVDRTPNMLVMNRRSRRQLRASRTATNATGAPAPIPQEVEGIPIICVESITNTETLL